MYTARSTLATARRYYPRLRLYRLRAAILKILNIAVILSMAVPNLTVFAAAPENTESPGDLWGSQVTIPAQETVSKVDIESSNETPKPHTSNHNQLQESSPVLYLDSDTLPSVSISRPGGPGAPWWVYGNTFGTAKDLTVGAVFRTMGHGPAAARMHCNNAGCEGARSMFPNSSTQILANGNYYCVGGYVDGYSAETLCNEVAPGAFVIQDLHYFSFQPGEYLAGGFKVGGDRDYDAQLTVYGIHFIYYGIPPVDNHIKDDAVLSDCGDSADGRGCAVSSQVATQGEGGEDSINSRTGGMDFTTVDLSLPTAAGSLIFQRSYASLATDRLTAPLGYGWTHNHDTRLIFPSDPDGREGYVLFKAHSANLYEIVDNGDGTYSSTAGVGVTLTQDPGPPITYTLTDSAQRVYTFEETGQLLTWTNARGNTWNYIYDDDDRLTQITDYETDRYIDLAYDGENRIESVSDLTGRYVSYTYDAAGDLATVTDVLEQIWTYHYDDKHHLTEVLDPRGIAVERTEYGVIVPSALDFDTYTIDSYGDNQDLDSTTTMEDDGATLHIVGNGWKAIDFPYRVQSDTVIEFDFRSYAQGEIQGIGLDDDNNLSLDFAFKLYGTQSSGLVDYDDYETAAPDWKHYVIPVGQFYSGDMTRLFFVNDHDVDNPTSDSSFSNVRVYDSNARALRQYNGEDEMVVEITYNADGTSTLKDALGNESVHEYDSRNTLVATYDPEGNDVQKTFDDNFRPTTITDENENTTELIWSDDGANLLQVIDAEENDPTVMEYDPLNNLIWIQDASGAETIFEYEGNLLTYSEDDLGNPTHYTYTPEGYLESVEDALGTVTYYTYNADGQRETTTLNYNPNYPQNHENKYNIVTTYVYDDLGNQIEVIDTYGRRTRYEYDAAGRLILSTQNYDPNHPQNYENQYNIVTEYVYDEVGNQIEAIDTHGRITRNEYDNTGRLIKTTRNYDVNRPQNDQNQYNIVTEYVYDAAGHQIEVIDTFGRRTRYEYDTTGRLIRTTQNYDPNLAQNHDSQYNIVTEYVYDAAGNQIRLIDTYDRITRYEYDALNRQSAVIANYVDGGPVDHETNVRTEYVYDEVGNMIKTIDALDRTTFNEYDSLGRLERTWQNYDPNRPQNDQNEYNIVTEYVYNEVGHRVQTIDPRDNPISYEYDALGRLERVTDALLGTTTYSYDALGNRLTVTDAENNPTTYEYDSLGRQVSVEDPEHNNSSTAYEALGNVISRTDSSDVVTRYEYDTLDRQTAVILNYLEGTPADHETNVRTEYSYDAVGNQRIVYDARGNPTETSYDALDRPTIVEDALEITTETVYDALGNVTVVKDGFGNPTSFIYDPLGRQETVTDAEDNSTTYAYDALGNRVSMTDANGVITRYEYDGLNRLTAVVENYVVGEPEDHETNVRTEYSYDPNGNRIEILDGNDHWTRFDYDALNRLVYESDMLENTTEYGYDKVGRKEWMKDAEGTYTYYQYDKVGRLTGIDYPDPDTDVTFTYDPNGNRETMTDGVGDTIWGYDPLGRVTSVQDPFDDIVSYGYDAVGNRQELDYPGEQAVSYVYDDTNRLTEVHDWSGSGVTYYTYDDADRLSTVTLPNDVVTTYTYDDAGQLLTLTHEADGTTLSSFTYTYDSVGNRTRAEEYYLTPGDGGPTVNVLVVDERGDPMADLPVYAFDGTTYTGYHENTDENGEAAITLPEGEYRFRVDVDGTQFWSGEANHCTIAGCTEVLFTIPDPVLIRVQDTSGTPMGGLSVYVFDGTTYTGVHAATDVNGEAVFRLVEGSYRFRVDLNGTQFWSGESNHCDVPGCTLVDIGVTIPVTVTVADSLGMPAEGVPVYAFSGGEYSGYHGTSDAAGQVTLTLPQGDYRFRADSNGTQFWSGETDHCSVPGCLDAALEITLPVTVTVTDSDGTPLADLPVYAFDETTYTGYHATTDASGQVSLTLPPGEYRFRADSNGTQFWSGETNHCTVPGCSAASVIVTLPVTVTVLDTDGEPAEGLPVYAFDDTTYTGFHATTDENGQVSLTLPAGEYRFRADKNGTQFWSAENNHCAVPGCSAAGVTVTNPLTVTVLDTDGQPAEGLPVYAFDDATYTGFHATTDSTGQVSLTLPLGDYRFRADKNGTQFWSGGSNHCTIPGCTEVGITVTLPVAVLVQDPGGQPLEGVPVYAFDESTYTGYHAPTDATGVVSLTLPLGDYRFRADYDGTQYWSGEGNHCTIPGCASVEVVVGEAPPEAFLRGAKRGLAKMLFARLAQGTIVVITVLDTDGQPAEGLPVYAFDESVYTGVHGTTDVAGQVSLDLPDGSYRFRADKNGTQFWSGETNHCTLPGCTEAAITVTLPVTITVSDTDDAPAEGLPVYAFDESTYTGYHATTDVSGQVSLILPLGDYRFRADKNGTQFWSGESNHCTLPGCTAAGITVTISLIVTVLDTDGVPAEGLPVYAFEETTYTGYHATTDASGQVSLTLPQGDYHFRADKSGTQFWSGASNHCTLPGCTQAGITVTIPVTVTVGSQSGDPYPDLPVYAFSGEGYTGFHGTTDENGQVVLTLPQGDYRFRADFDGVHFWSSETDHCSVPGCLEAAVELPGGGTAEQAVTIDYTYDPLYRLTAADYDSGEYFHYTYDAVGNRLTQETKAGTNTYSYDIANRLTSVDGVSYTWSANGNLLSDGESTYTYNHANRLTSVTQGEDSYSYAYNGLGDRLAQTENGETTNYTLDTVTGLTQVLDDVANAYLYGLDRIGEERPAGWAYHLPDALGSVRQLTDADASVTLARAYEPFGSVMASSGPDETSYSFTGEWADGTGLVHLRARYYTPWQGRFISSDLWNGNPHRPTSYNTWLYVYSNPVNYFDPSGFLTKNDAKEADEIYTFLKDQYNIRIQRDWGWVVPQFWIPFLSSVSDCRWDSGEWDNISELRLVKDTFDKISAEIGGPEKLKRAVDGPVHITRVDGDLGSMAPPGIGAIIFGDIVFSDYTFSSSDSYARKTIAHEFGHVWDHRSRHRLSQGLMEIVGTWVCDDNGECGWNPYQMKINPITLEAEYPEPPPGANPSCWGPPGLTVCTEPYSASYGFGGEEWKWVEQIFRYYGWWPGWDDWADSFAAYIYPSYFPSRGETGLGPIRKAYIKLQISKIK